MATPSDWLAAARPRTLSAAVAPVAVGVGVAGTTGHLSGWRAGLCLVVAVAMQLGANYANDYADGVKGTDARRIGPTRLVASGLATPRAVRAAALGCFAAAAVTGTVLAATTAPWLFGVGAASIAAGWFYTAGSHPYGYIGLGEVAVFIFFGLVATSGTVYVSCGRLPWVGIVAAVPVGLVAVALLVVNNLRDIASDAASGKTTLAVRLGGAATRHLYVGCVLGAFVTVVVISTVRRFALLALVAALLALPPLRRVRSGAEGRELVVALGMTGALQLALGAVLALGIAL